MRVVTGDEMRLIEQKAMERLEVSSLLLMEIAGSRLADLIVREYGCVAAKKIYVLAGTGNNGGDGLVAARHLLVQGARPKIYLAGDPAGATSEHKTNLNILRKLGVEVVAVDTTHPDRLRFALGMADLIIDALVGTGFTGSLSPELHKIIQTVNRLQRPIVAVDVPSGVDASSGQVKGEAIRAELTINLGLLKAGCLLHPGRDYAGKIRTIDLGIPLADSDFPTRYLLGQSILDLPPNRDKAGHKGSFGHVLVVGGSRIYAGAPALSGQAVLRGGAGMATLAVPQSIAARFPADELIIVPMENTSAGALSEDALPDLLQLAEGMDVLVVGPGLSCEAESLSAVQALLADWERPAVIDADALRILLTEFLETIRPEQRARWIVTPHPGEMARLLGNTAAEVNKNRLGAAQEFAKKWGLVTVLKGAPTIISDGEKTYINSTGSHGLATAGTGDVLAGLIGSFLAQGLEPLEAAAVGVYTHGAAADLAGETGQRSLIASDCLKLLTQVLP